MYVTQSQVTCGSSCGPVFAPDYAMALGHWAKVELLKEKVKQRMDKRLGSKLDHVADMIAELALERAKNEWELEAKQEALGRQLDELGDEE